MIVSTLLLCAGLFASEAEKYQPERLPRRFSYGASLGLNLGVFPIPSGELSLFLGGTARVYPRRPGHWVAVGYKGAVGIGAADALAVSGDFPYGDGSPVVHRHHVAVQGVAGRRSKLAYGASLGLVIASFGSAHEVHGTTYGGPAFGVEVEGRIGRTWNIREDRLQGVFGGQFRVTRVFVTGDAPWPTLGFFVGFAFAPFTAEQRLPALDRSPPRIPRRDYDGDGAFDMEDRCPRDVGRLPYGCPEIDRDREGAFVVDAS
jgi:hypothetical protein